MNDSQEKKGGEDHNKEFKIIVNGRERVVTKKEMSFMEIVALADLSSGPNIIYTITYRRGEGDKQGTLVEGDSIKIKDGMIFNVTATDKS